MSVMRCNVMSKEQRLANRMKAINEWNNYCVANGERPMPKRVWEKAFT